MHIDRISNDVNYVNKTSIGAEETVDSINKNLDKNIESGKIRVNPSENQESIREYSEEDIIEMIEKANEDFVAYDRKFEFSIHEKTKKISVKVLDTVTDEVIRELPPEKILDMVAGIWEVAGILVDEKV